MVLDLSPASAAVSLLGGSTCNFSLARHGGVCVAPGTAAERDAVQPPWLRLLPASTSADGELTPTALFEALRAAWRGRL